MQVHRDGHDQPAAPHRPARHDGFERTVPAGATGVARPPRLSIWSVPLLQRAVGNQVVGRLLANHAPVSGTCPGPAADVSRDSPGVVQRLVAQITAADGLRVDRLNVVGRPASPYSGTMGDHTTAFAVVLESVRRLVERQPFDRAVAGLWQLFESARDLPGYALVAQLPAAHRGRLTAAEQHVRDIHAEIGPEHVGELAETQRMPLLQQFVGAYLHYRELVPLSVINIKAARPALAGKGKGESGPRDRLRLHVTGQPRLAKPELRATIAALFDRHAVALLAAEHDITVATAMAPGVIPATAAEERVRLPIRQHLATVEAAFPTVVTEAWSDRAAAEEDFYRSTMSEVVRLLGKDAEWYRERLRFLRSRVESRNADVVVANGRKAKEKIQQEIAEVQAEIRTYEGRLRRIDELLVAGRAASAGGESSARLSETSAADEPYAAPEQERDAEASGRDERDEAEAEERKEPLATQIVLGQDGTVAEMHSAGRSPTPFPGTMGAHSTAWVVHLDGVRAAILGKTIPDAVAAVTKLADESKAMATRLVRNGFTDAPEQGRRRGEAKTLMESYPAAIAAAQPTAAPLLLQSYVNALLTYVNFIPGIAAESADTGGKGEGRSRRIVREHESGRHPASQQELRAAILGLLDIRPHQVSNERQRALVSNHLSLVERAYPQALADAKITDAGHGLKLWSELVEESQESGTKRGAAASGSSSRKRQWVD